MERNGGGGEQKSTRETRERRDKKKKTFDIRKQRKRRKERKTKERGKDKLFLCHLKIIKKNKHNKL